MGDKNNMSFFEIFVIFLAGLMAGYVLFAMIHNTEDLFENENEHFCPYCGNLIDEN